MYGQAQNAGGPIRNVGGSYGMNYSWQTGLGSFQASFDNRNYGGGVVGTGGANFAGAFVGGNRIGTLAGAFNTSRPQAARSWAQSAPSASAVRAMWPQACSPAPSNRASEKAAL